MGWTRPGLRHLRRGRKSKIEMDIRSTTGNDGRRQYPSPRFQPHDSAGPEPSGESDHSRVPVAWARRGQSERSTASRTKFCCRSTNGRHSSRGSLTQSGSLKPERESIAKRFDRIYKELGIIEKSGNNAFKQHGQQPLLTVVAEFGNSVDLITPKPIDDLAAVNNRQFARSKTIRRITERGKRLSVGRLSAEKFSPLSIGVAAQKRDDRCLHRRSG